MHFLITGGAGFIGSHLSEQLLDEDHFVTVVDNFSTGVAVNLPRHDKLTVLDRDVRDCRDHDLPPRIDAIAHLAGTPSVQDSWKDVLAAHENNLTATIHMIRLCIASRIRRLVFASSAAVYGESDALRLREGQDTMPSSPYGLQKLACEHYGRLFANGPGPSFIALRMFNVFGPRQHPSSSYSGVISKFVSAVRVGDALRITGDGSQTRDFVFVKDAAKAFALALNADLPNAQSAVCNIGTGRAISLLQLLDVIAARSVRKAPVKIFAPAVEGDIKHSCADISAAKELLNFSPSYSLETGLSELMAQTPNSPGGTRQT